MKSIELLFDIVSPNAYIASRALPKIAAAANAEIRWTPVFIGGIFKATENARPMLVKGKGAWMGRDMARCMSEFGGMPFQMNPHFPLNTITVMRGAVAYRDAPFFEAYVARCFRAMWADAEDVSDPATIGRILADVGIDAEAFAARVADQSVKDELKRLTDDAVARGAFGLPTFFIGETLYFGQDRLHHVAADLGVDIRDVFPDHGKPSR